MKRAVNIPMNSSIPISWQRKKGDLNHSSYKLWRAEKKNVKQDEWNDWQLNANRELMETKKKKKTPQGHVKS